MDFAPRLKPRMPLYPVRRIRGFFKLKLLFPAVLSALLCLTASAQTTSQCTTAGTAAVVVASNGLAEKLGNIVLSCTGGSSGSSVIGELFVTLNTNITNSLDVNGNPQNISITSAGAAVTATTPILSSANTLQIANFSYVVPAPNTLPVNITISGLRGSVASIQNGLPGVVSATLFGVGVNIAGTSVDLGIGAVTLQSSTQNNGIPCAGSPLPSTTDFPTFISAGTTSSAVRVTEAALGAFAPQDPTATNGVRIIVQLSGYPTGAQLFVPNALVGNSGSIPTAAGEFGSTVAGGSYVPSANQLLWSLVVGADRNGAGGTLVYPAPVAGQSFTSMTQLTVTNGSAYAVYEVVDHNPYVLESVQAPVFEVSAPYSCSTLAQATISVTEAPVSTVSVATVTDPVPRYIAASLASDCQQEGDCGAVYYPVLSVNTTPVTLNGASLGATQIGSISVVNNGGSALSFTTSISYQSGSNWLTVTPSSGDDRLNATLTVSANPAALQPGIYNAAVTVNAGTAGSTTVSVIFNVGQPGVTIQGIVNAASFQTGAISPGSYVALFGLNLAGTNVGVTVNSLPAQVLYDSAGQINLIVPGTLTVSSATVYATVNGQLSNPFVVTLAPNVPGIFTPGIVNSTGSVNAASSPATHGTFVSIYLTGLAIPVTGTVTVNMGSQTGIAPLPGQTYVQPTYPALDQVNVTVPAGLVFTGNSVPLAVCVTTSPGQPVCSNAVTLYVQ